MIVDYNLTLYEAHSIKFKPELKYKDFTCCVFAIVDGFVAVDDRDGHTHLFPLASIECITYVKKIDTLRYLSYGEKRFTT